jgi:SAM-dependent methyltransferase
MRGLLAELALRSKLREESGVSVVELDRLSRTLMRDASGMWTAPRSSAVDARLELSFPEAFYQSCFEVEDASFWFRHRNECIFTSLSRWAFEGPLLDVGGGNGAVSASLQHRGIPTVLLEPGIDGARNALRRGVADVVCATLEGASFEPGSFGAAGLFDVAEHVEDDVELLRSVHRVLRPGGVLSVTVPAHPWLWADEDVEAGHFRRYTLASLRTLLERASFEVRYETYMFAPLVAPIFLLRTVRHRWFRRPRAVVNETSTRQHTPPSLARSALDLALGREAGWIRAGKRVPIGTSCLVVATAGRPS